MNSFEQYRNRRHALLRISILFIVLALALGCYAYAHGASLDNASIHVQAMQGGQPLGNTEYQLLSDNGLIAGRTDASGMVLATGIDSGAWTLAIGCARATVYAAEVQGQVIEQVEMACVVWLPGVMR